MKKKFLAAIVAMTMAVACMTACSESSSTAETSKTESSSKAETTTSAADASSQTETTTTTAETTTTEQTTTSKEENDITVDAASELVLLKLAKQMYSAEDLTGDKSFKSTFKSKLKSSQNVSVCASIKTDSFFDPFKDLICDEREKYAQMVPEAQVFYLSDKTKSGDFAGEITADAFACKDAESADNFLELLKSDMIDDFMRIQTNSDKYLEKVENAKSEKETRSYLFSYTQGKETICYGCYELGSNIYCLCLVYPTDLTDDQKPDTDIKEAFEKLCNTLGMKSPAQLQ